MKSLFIFLFIIKLISATPTPVVIWHGMGDTCCLSISLGAFKQFLEEKIPGVYVTSLRIGKNTIEDFESGYFVHPDVQVEYVCQLLSKDPKLKDGFNAIGFSQGGQFLRAVVQRCGTYLTVKNLITFGGQHQGVYGLPHCGALQQGPCDYVRQLLNYAAYNSWVQHSLVQATYWHDPLAEELYKIKSTFLADINNELNINSTYNNNINNLEHFVMVKFEADSIVQPRETEWFGFYAPGQGRKVIPFNETSLYIEDRLGLNNMEGSGKLVFLSTPGEHLHLTDEFLIESIIKPYLLN